jgi:hypothetical protein
MASIDPKALLAGMRARLERDQAEGRLDGLTVEALANAMAHPKAPDVIAERQHRSLEERVEVGQACMLKLALEMPAAVDAMDDGVARAYAAMPERLYLVGRDGRVAYKGGLGPMFFRPAEWEAAIERHLAAGS